MSLEIKADGQILVRAPLRLSETKIRKFVEEKQGWILKNLEKIQKRNRQKECVEQIPEEEKDSYSKKHVRYFQKGSPFLQKKQGLLMEELPCVSRRPGGGAAVQTEI